MTELAAQVTSVARSVTRHMPLRVICVTGGASAKTQKRMLDEGVDVVIGTPGRVQYLIDEGMVRHPVLYTFDTGCMGVGSLWAGFWGMQASDALSLFACRCVCVC